VEPASPTVLSRSTLAIATALGTMAFGAIISYGALEHSIGWGDRGPETGYFPFRMGVVIMLASLVTLVEAIIARTKHAGEAAVTADQAGRIARFFLPMLAFLAVTTVAGIYVAMILYLFGVMIWQGGYRFPAATLVSLGTAVAFYLLFERWLKVPLIKGPLEAWLGIH
jgi:Tripartite tricarboxylate transporter TctB family